MKIIDANVPMDYDRMAALKEVDLIIFHHSAVARDQSPEFINNFHKNNRGWAGAGYHFQIMKDGTIYSLRPLHKQGVHTANTNGKSIGIMLTGDFRKEEPTAAQKKSANWLYWHLKSTRAKDAKPSQHNKHQSTICPGPRFNLAEITKPLPKPEPDKGKYYRVQVGAFSKKSNADNYAKELEKKGIETYIVHY